MNRFEITKLLAGVSSAYPAFRLDTEGAIAAQWEYILQAFRFEDAERALKAYIESGKDFAPSPGHIAAILRRWQIKAEKVSSWEEGFELAKRIAKQHGAEHSKTAAKAAKMISPRLYLCIKQFGYRTLCGLFKAYTGEAGATEDDIKYARIKFERLWKEITLEVESSGYLGYQQVLMLGDSKAPALVAETSKQIRGIE